MSTVEEGLVHITFTGSIVSERLKENDRVSQEMQGVLGCMSNEVDSNFIDQSPDVVDVIGVQRKPVDYLRDQERKISGCTVGLGLEEGERKSKELLFQGLKGLVSVVVEVVSEVV